LYPTLAAGIAGLYRGVAAVGIGAGPAHAVYFATYEYAKDAFGGGKPGHHPLAHAAAGICATILGKGRITFWGFSLTQTTLPVTRHPRNYLSPPSLPHCASTTQLSRVCAITYKRRATVNWAG
jgi:hypothetical protein